MSNRVSSFPAASAISPLHRHGGKITALSELSISNSADDFIVEGNGTVLTLPAIVAGVKVFLRTTGTPTFKNSAKLVCPGGTDYVATAGDLLIARSDGDGVWRLYVLASAAAPQNVPGGTLSPASGDPCPETDTTTSILYLVLTDRFKTECWNGTAWISYQYSGELQLALDTSAHLSSKNYDVFETPIAGVMTLCTGPAWTNDTTRSITIENFQGRLVNSAQITCVNGTNSYTVPARAANLRGGFRASANGQTKTTSSDRLVSDLLRPTVKPVSRIDTTDSWSWSSNSFQQANNSAANRIAVFNCSSGRSVDVTVNGYMLSTTSTIVAGYLGVGIDSSSVDSSQTKQPCAASNAFPVLPGFARYVGFAGLGYHEFRWLEHGNGSGITQTWQGDGGQAVGYQTGIVGTVLQ
jgi:hypothetical protein